MLMDFLLKKGKKSVLCIDHTLLMSHYLQYLAVYEKISLAETFSHFSDSWIHDIYSVGTYMVC